jgi:GT2 family glycosyltransferase
MPQPSDWELYQSSTIHPTVGQGGAMVVPIPWFIKVGGFDEAYEVWGAEDNDLVLRAQWDGLPIEWLPEESAWVVHQYHNRAWPTTKQADQVKRNRVYLAERIAAKGPIIRNI